MKPFNVEEIEAVISKAAKTDAQKEIVRDIVDTAKKLDDMVAGIFKVAADARYCDRDTTLDLLFALHDSVIDYAYTNAQVVLGVLFDDDGTMIEVGDSFVTKDTRDKFKVTGLEVDGRTPFVYYGDNPEDRVSPEDIAVIDKADGTHIAFPKGWGMPKNCPIKCGKCVGRSLACVDCRFAQNEYERVTYVPFHSENRVVEKAMKDICNILRREDIDPKEPIAYLYDDQRDTFKAVMDKLKVYALHKPHCWPSDEEAAKVLADLIGEFDKTF